MDAIDFLVRHHRDLEGKLEKLKESEESVSKDDFNQLADALVSHITIEEEIFYPAVKAQRTEDILLESLEEHLSLKRVLSDLVGMSAEDETFGPKLHVLAEQAEHHHKEEEENLFPKVKKLMDKADRAALGALLEDRMESLLRKSPREQVHSQTDEAAALA